MFQKWIRVLIIIGILFSYFPFMPLQHCPEGSHEGRHEGDHHEGDHKEDGKLNCGYIFHCPFTFHFRFSEPLVILNTEKLESILSSITFGDFRFPIFHPPEGKRNYSHMNPEGNEGQIGTRVAAKHLTGLALDPLS